MKRFKDWSFQNKLFFVNLLIVLLVVFAITTVMTQTAARLATNSNFASLNLDGQRAKPSLHHQRKLRYSTTDEVHA